MYFSKHNENITYINHYSGLLEVKGKGLLCREDTELWHESSRNWAKKYDTLSVTEGITGLGEGYIEFFSHIDCLILSRTVESIATSPELLKRWRKSKVLIRNEYNSRKVRGWERPQISSQRHSSDPCQRGTAEDLEDMGE